MKKYFLYSFLSFFGIFLIGETIFITFTWFSSQKRLYVSGKHIVYTNNDSRILGIDTESSYLQINFAKQISTGHPLIFGGTQVPDLSHKDAWEKIQKVGVTSIRKDFFPEYTLPTNISINDYLQNKNNITDPKNWRTLSIEATQNNYHFAKNSLMKTIGILSYNPTWLTYTNTQYGIPRNWDIYEDILKKLYKIYRPNLDYLEVWNEPTYRIFLDPSNSGLTREEAYLQLFLHASHAIREVDSEINDGKRIKIGGQVSHEANNLSIAEYLLKNEQAKKQLDFISFHHYGPMPPDFNIWKQLLIKNGIPNLPIFLSEWNYTTEVKNNLPQLTDSSSIPYTGNMLISYLLAGIEGANYYSLFPVDKNFKNMGHGYLAFYDWDNNQAKLLPQSKTWELLSKVLGLGSGESTIYSTTNDPNIFATGFKNSEGVYGLAVSNSSKFTKKINVDISGLPYKGYLNLNSYKAQIASSPSAKISETTLKVSDGNLSYVIAAQPESVTGILITQTGVIKYNVDDLLRKLYVR